MNSIAIQSTWKINDELEIHKIVKQGNVADGEDIAQLKDEVFLEREPNTATSCELSFTWTSPIVINSLIVLSTSRLAEIYVDGEYVGTARGQVVTPQDNTTAYTKNIEINKPTNAIRIKFFSLINKTKLTLYSIKISTNSGASTQSEGFNSDAMGLLMSTLMSMNSTSLSPLASLLPQLMPAMKDFIPQANNVTVATEISPKKEESSIALDVKEENNTIDPKIKQTIDKACQDMEEKLMKRIDERLDMMQSKFEQQFSAFMQANKGNST